MTVQCICQIIDKMNEKSQLTSHGYPSFETIDPIHDLNLRDLNDACLIDSYQAQFGRFFTFNCVWCPSFSSHYKQMIRKEELAEELNVARFQLSRQSLGYYPEYECKLKVLKELDYVTDDSDMCLKTKGRVGCLISEFEIILTELLTENVFTELSQPYIAALLSCLVFRLKTDEPPNLDPVMEKVRLTFIVTLITY